jgi:hypothetical protein
VATAQSTSPDLVPPSSLPQPHTHLSKSYRQQYQRHTRRHSCHRECTSLRAAMRSHDHVLGARGVVELLAVMTRGVGREEEEGGTLLVLFIVLQGLSAMLMAGGASASASARRRW